MASKDYLSLFPGAFSSTEGEDFRAVIEEIIRIKYSSCDVPQPESGRWQSAGAAILGDEFSLAWRVLDAQFWGVAQRRRRIFLVADFGGCTAPQILFEQDRLFGNIAQSRGSGQGTATTIEGGSDDSGGACLIPWDVQSRRIFEETGTWPALYSGQGGGHGYIQTEEKEAVGFEGYNGDLTGEVSSTLGVNCGMSTGRNGIITQASVAFHVNQRDEVIDLDGVSGALLATRNMQMQTFVAQEPLLCLNDHGGERMDITEEVTPTLRAGMGGHPPLITQPSSAGMSGNNQPVLFENHPKDGRYNGPLGVAPTLAARMGTGGNNVPLVGNPVAFSLDSKESNSMKSSNPNSGCRETEIARTIDTTNPDPSKNQGGIAILQESFCIAGNIIDRQVQNGGNGLGCQPDISYTLTGADRHAVFSRQRSDEFSENEVVATQSARQHKDATDLVCQPEIFGQSQFGNYSEGCTTLRAQGGDNGGGSENLIAIADGKNRKLIRRLTPLECERLQGFPDGWTNIPGGSDSARYKALGNSVAIPCVDFVMRGIAYFLKRIYSEQED